MSKSEQKRICSQSKCAVRAVLQDSLKDAAKEISELKTSLDTVISNCKHYATISHEQRDLLVLILDDVTHGCRDIAGGLSNKIEKLLKR